MGTGQEARRAPSFWLAVAAGTIIALGWLPLGVAPFLWVAFLLMMRALRRAQTGHDALLLGVLCGVARYAIASHFMLSLLRYSPLAIAYYLLSILYVIPFGALEGWGALALERWAGIPRTLGYAVMWALAEKARTLTDLSFPAENLAHGFGTAPGFLAAAPLVGPFGVVFLLALAACCLDQAIEWWRTPALRAAWLGGMAALWLLPAGIGAVAGRGAEPDAARVLRIGIVQPVIEVEEKLRRERWPALWGRLRELTLEAARGNDLVVWPESVRPGVAILRDGVIEDRELSALAVEAGVPILYGTVIAEVEGRQTVALYNGAALARPDGSFGGWYGKRRLLPLVEGIPFGSHFGWDPRRRAAGGAKHGVLGLLGNFTAGPRPTVFEVGPARIGVLICYEGMYPQLGRALRQQGANVLAVLTNDIWWGRSVFPSWHAQMVASRARELGVPVVRAANNGISSITDTKGRLLARTELDELRTATFEVATGAAIPTFYARHGDLVIVLLLAVVALKLPHEAWRRARRRAFQPPPVESEGSPGQHQN